MNGTNRRGDIKWINLGEDIPRLVKIEMVFEI